MKDIIIKLGNRFFTLYLTILVSYFLFSDELRNFEYVNFIRYFIIILCLFYIIRLFLFLGKIKNKKNKQATKNKISSPKSLNDFIYFYSIYIINYSFYIYFFLYIIFEFDRKSILFNYILLILFGLFLGFKYAANTFVYLDARKDNQKEKK